jgi:hypothetical protein
MNHPDTKHMLELVEQLTDYRVSVDLISGIHEHAQMISARPESPVHLIRVNSSQRSFADYIVAVQCGMLLILWSDPLKGSLFVAGGIRMQQAFGTLGRTPATEFLGLRHLKESGLILCSGPREAGSIDAARIQRRQACL